jgi:hypothetical protein
MSRQLARFRRQAGVMTQLLRRNRLTIAPIGGSFESGPLYHLQMLCQHKFCRPRAVWTATMCTLCASRIAHQMMGGANAADAIERPSLRCLSNPFGG